MNLHAPDGWMKHLTMKVCRVHLASLNLVLPIGSGTFREIKENEKYRYLDAELDD